MQPNWNRIGNSIICNTVKLQILSLTTEMCESIDGQSIAVDEYNE